MEPKPRHEIKIFIGVIIRKTGPCPSGLGERPISVLRRFNPCWAYQIIVYGGWGVKHPPGLITLATSANLRAAPIKTLDFGSINGYNKQSQRCFGSPIGRGNRFKNGKVSVRVRPEAQQVCKDSTTEMKVSWYE